MKKRDPSIVHWQLEQALATFQRNEHTNSTTLACMQTLTRYFHDALRVVNVYEYPWIQHQWTCTRIHFWARDVRSRKSTAGGAITHGRRTVLSWSKNQASGSLSSAEAEFYSLIMGSLKGPGMVSLLKDVGVERITF